MSDAKIAYGSSAALTCTLASLATSSTHVAGRESTAVDNTSNLYTDYLLSGKITTGTSPTDAKEIRIYVYGSMNDTPDYMDVLDGTDSDETITDANVLNTMKLAAVLPTDDTSDQTYYLDPISIAALFGGVVPKYWGVFVSHNTGQDLNATGSNHALEYTGIYHTMS